MSKFIKILIIVSILAGAWMLITPNYLRTSLIYWYANIDDYTIFENKEVSIAMPISKLTILLVAENIFERDSVP